MWWWGYIYNFSNQEDKEFEASLGKNRPYLKKYPKQKQGQWSGSSGRAPA
jgi:hypothetical protein